MYIFKSCLVEHYDHNIVNFVVETTRLMCCVFFVQCSILCRLKCGNVCIVLSVHVALITDL